MQTLKIPSLVTFFMALVALGLPMGSCAQKTTTEAFPVAGNCGMCKSNIEKAAKKAGAADATWDVDGKILTFKYNSSSTNTAKIQQAVAAAGYDTRDVKATDEAYGQLHSCCQYDRTGVSTNEQRMDCCKDGKCSKPGHDGKDCCKKDNPDMDCCKDVKCSKEGDVGNDCCKPSHSH